MTTPFVEIEDGHRLFVRAELIPQSRLVVYVGAAHGVMFTHAERLAADIQRDMR